MTEAEWLACTDPTPMLAFLRGKASERKLRLFACACVSQILPLSDPHTDETRLGLELVAKFADGRSSKEAMKRVRKLMRKSRGANPPVRTNADDFVCYAVEYAATEKNYLRTISYSAGLLETWGKGIVACKQITLFRDIFGNPFRPVTVDPHWLTWSSGTIPKLAQEIYNGRRLPQGTLDNTRLAILADALEEAGCTNPDILDHCRKPGTHVRGCWVIDLILGKS
jgi:hypothetical protein